MIHNKLIFDASDRFKYEQLIPKETAETLKIIDPETLKFHLLLKIHTTNYPGRLVVSSIGCHSTNISKFVDCHLQPIEKNTNCYMQDSSDFLNKINTIKKKTTKKNIPTN